MGRFRHRKTGARVEHTKRKYKRREKLYERRVMCNIPGDAIATEAGIAHVDYFRLERLGDGDHRSNPMTSDTSRRSPPLQWTETAKRVCDVLFADPEDMFEEEAKRRDRLFAEALGTNADLVAEHTVGRYSRRSADAWELRSILQRALEALPEDIRETMCLRCDGAWNGAEKRTAAELGISEQGVQRRMRKARFLLLQSGFVSALAEFTNDPSTAMDYVRGEASKLRREYERKSK